MIFREAGILENFIFEEVSNPEELEGKLLMGSYDLYIGSVDLGSKKDILALFATEDSLLNPSKYRNPILSSLIKQYTKSPTQSVIGEINVVLAQDMPIVLLGTIYTPLQMKTTIAEEVFADEEDIYATNWRWKIFATYSIVHNVRIDPKNALKWQNFKAFIMENISDGVKLFKREKKAEGPIENPFEKLVQEVTVE